MGEKRVNQSQKKIEICFFKSGEVMWALSLKYVVMMQAWYEKAM